MSEIKTEIKENGDCSYTITDAHTTADILRWLLTQDTKETILFILNEEALAEQPAQQDIPDLIAGALGVSRGTAYDMMREALAEQPAQQAVSRATYNRLRYDYDDLVKKSKRDAIDAKLWREHVNHCQLQGVDLDHNFAQRKENT